MAAKEFSRLMDGLPPRERPKRDSFPTQSKGVRLWIEGLPLANSSATTKLLLNGIKELNQLEVDALVRMDMLEEIRRPTIQVIAGLEKHILAQPLPLTPQKQQIASVLREFHRELSVGYRIVMADLCGPRGTVPFLRGRYAALALTRAMSHWGDTILKAYFAYAEPPEGSYRLMHAMMDYAQTAGLSDKGAVDPLLPTLQLTPKVIYLQTMLLALANPYRLTQKEMVDLHAAAAVWSWQCELLLDGSGEGAFVLDPNGDHGPGVRAPEGRFWRLDTRHLVRSLREKLARAQAETQALSMPLLHPKSKIGESEPLALELIDRVLAAWGFTGERGHQRMAAGHQMDCAVGLSAAHQALSNGNDFNTFIQQLARAGVSLSDRERSGVWAQHNAEAGRLPTLNVRVLDQSLGGYRINWAHAEGIKAKVGEVIVLSTPNLNDANDERDWLFGVLRWLRGGSGDALEAGVQLLARSAEPVALRAVADDGRSSVLHRAVLLQPLGPDEPVSVLLPAIVGNRASGQLLRLPDPMADLPVSLTSELNALKILENTGSVARFAVTDSAQAAVFEPLSRESLEAGWANG